MTLNLRLRLLHRLTPSLLCALMAPAFADAQEKTVVPGGNALNITVTAAATSPPPVSIILHDRHGHVTPLKSKCAHTGGGLIDVASPAPDTVIVTMQGAVVANATMPFDLEQCFEVSFDDPKVKKAKLSVEGRVIGLLRGERKGSAEYSEAGASVSAGPVEIITTSVPPHQVCGCESLAVNDHDGPKAVPVQPGKYTLHGFFSITATSNSLICKRPSAEFAPDPALDPLWINYWEPFHGVKKDTFGFQIILKVAPDNDEASTDKKTAELPPAKSTR